jgi:EmrB/QacA subfamily drug resistance transporter
LNKPDSSQPANSHAASSEGAALEVPPPAQRWLAMLGIGVGILMVTIDFSIINISLPTLVREFDTNFATVQWVVLSYVLIITSLMLGMARLGDMYGKKRIFACGVVVFTLGSLLCGMAANVGWLIGARAFQGLGGVMIQALGMAIVTQVFPVSERGRALGVVGGIVSTGLALGPALGGVIIGTLGWRWIFWVNVPIGVVCWFMAVRFLPSSPVTEKGARFDSLGALLICLALTAYALGMTFGQRMGFSEPLVLGLLGAAAIGVAGFIMVQRRVKWPTMNLDLFKDRLFGVNLTMSFLVFITLGTSLVVPFFMDLVMGLNTMEMGLMMMVVPIGMGVISPFAGVLTDRHGPRVISILGLLVTVGGCIAMTTIHKDITMGGLVLRVIPLGIGLGLFQSPNNTAVMSAAPPKHLGVASGLLALSRTLGNTSGVPLAGALFTTVVLAAAGLGAGALVTSASPEALTQGVRGVYIAAAVLDLAAAVLAVVAWRMDLKRAGQ